MAKKATPKSGQEISKEEKQQFLFGKRNYWIMFGGILIIALGYLLMVGGKSSDPTQFHPDQVYSFRRITLAPIVIIIGLIVEIVAIMYKDKSKA